MPKHPWHEVQASVMVENAALDEYSAKTEGNVASAWIPSIVGKEFQIQLSSEKQLHESVNIVVYFDGREVDAFVKDHEDADPKQHYIDDVVKGLRVGETTIRRFKFTKVPQTSGSGMNASSSSVHVAHADDIGTICIAIYRVKLTVGDKDSSWTQRYAEKGFSELIDKDNRKKACSHMIGLSDKTVEYGHESGEVYDVTYLDGETNPCAIFRFMYRERDFLQSRGIVPGSSSKKRKYLPHQSPAKYISDCKSSASKRAKGTQNQPQSSEVAGDLARKLESRRMQSIHRLEAKQVQIQTEQSSLQVEVQRQQGQIISDMQLEVQTHQDDLHAEIEMKLISLQAECDGRQTELRVELQRKQAELQAEMQRRQADLQADVLKRQTEVQIDLEKKKAEAQANLRIQHARILAEAQSTALKWQSELSSQVQAKQMVLQKAQKDVWRELTNASEPSGNPLAGNREVHIKQEDGSHSASEIRKDVIDLT